MPTLIVVIVTDDDNENIDTVILISSMTDTVYLYTPSDYATILKKFLLTLTYRINFSPCIVVIINIISYRNY